MCWAPAGRPCEPDCLALLPADQQIAHRDAVMDRALTVLGDTIGVPWTKRSDPGFIDDDPDISNLDRMDGVGRRYRLAADCGLGRHRANPPRSRWRAVLAIAVLVLILTAGALWFAHDAKAEYFTVCPSGLSGVASADTSCAFADNVRAAWYSQPGLTIFAYSPVTAKFYTMQCRMTWTDVWEWDSPTHCFGINESGAVLSVYVA